MSFWSTVFLQIEGLEGKSIDCLVHLLHSNLLPLLHDWIFIALLDTRQARDILRVKVELFDCFALLSSSCCS